MSETVIVAIVGTVGAVIGSLLTQLFTRRKNSADADKSTADANEQIRETVMLLIEPLKKRVTDLEKEVKDLQDENADLRTWAEALVAQLKSLGKDPVPFKTRVKNRNE